MFTIDIAPNPLQISLGNGGGGSSSIPKAYIKFIDSYDNSVKYAYVYNGILYISDQAP